MKKKYMKLFITYLELGKEFLYCHIKLQKDLLL